MRILLHPRLLRSASSFFSASANLRTLSFPRYAQSPPLVSTPHVSNKSSGNPFSISPLFSSLGVRSFRIQNIMVGDSFQTNIKDGDVEAKLTLPDGVVVLEGDSTVEGGVCKIYLVGVCIGLKKSCEDVKTVINLVKPDVVFFQVCEAQAPCTFAPPELNDMHENPMLVGYEEGKKCGARLDLGDILWDVQLLRALGSLSAEKDLRSKYQECKKLIEDDDKSFADLTIEEILEEIKRDGLPTDRVFPDLEKILIHERSMFMSATLLKVAKDFKSIVAIVGWAHLDGIKEHWKHPVDISKLYQIPSERPSDLAMKTLKLMHKGASEYMDHVNLLDK